MTQSRARLLYPLSYRAAISVLCLACAALQPSASPQQPEVLQPEATPADAEPDAPGGDTRRNLAASEDVPSSTGGLLAPVVETQDNTTDEALFEDLLDNHWARIFPNGDRNVGGPQFFKYIYEQLATSHDLFKRYSRFYCGVSGAIVRPSDEAQYELVKIKNNAGRCVVGKYYRCCWPCACDIMKYARVEQATLRLPNDPSGQEETYWVLTIGDPCYRCASSPCADLPAEVTTYECKDNVTSNGIRVSEGRLTNGPGRLVFALLHDAVPADQVDEAMMADLMARCTPRINASPEELKAMGGMGNIFVEVARVNSDETLTNTLDDLCD
jgi:hypothetical protein